jgi:hypothetical protein
MYLLGHTDARFTMSVYQQASDMGAAGAQALVNVVGCGLDEAREMLLGRGFGHPMDTRPKKGRRSGLRERSG